MIPTRTTISNRATTRLLAATSSALLATAAHAADLSAKDDAAGAFNWTGFYVGAQLGYGRLRQTDNVTITHSGNDLDKAHRGIAERALAAAEKAVFAASDIHKQRQKQLAAAEGSLKSAKTDEQRSKAQEALTAAEKAHTLAKKALDEAVQKSTDARAVAEAVRDATDIPRIGLTQAEAGLEAAKDAQAAAEKAVLAASDIYKQRQGDLQEAESEVLESAPSAVRIARAEKAVVQARRAFDSAPEGAERTSAEQVLEAAIARARTLTDAETDVEKTHREAQTAFNRADTALETARRTLRNADVDDKAAARAAFIEARAERIAKRDALKTAEAALPEPSEQLTTQRGAAQAKLTAAERAHTEAKAALDEAVETSTKARAAAFTQRLVVEAQQVAESIADAVKQFRAGTGSGQRYQRTANGLTYGGHIGGQFQINALIVGIEGRMDWGKLDLDPVACRGLSSVTCAPATKVNWLGAGLGKLGVAHDRWMIYGLFGLAWANIDDGLPGSDDTVQGKAFGGGMSYAFTDNWVFSADYLRYDLKERSGQHIAYPGGEYGLVKSTLDIKQDTAIDTFTARVSYKF